jgi:aminobenzoyl-glutamate utilization protein B
MKETKSSKVLADYAQEQGFRVTRGKKYLPLLLLNMEAATIIGVLGEFDALPGLSQKHNLQRGFK